MALDTHNALGYFFFFLHPTQSDLFEQTPPHPPHTQKWYDPHPQNVGVHRQFPVDSTSRVTHAQMRMGILLL